MRLLVHNCHKGFLFTPECKQDLKKENQLQTTHQLYHCPFHLFWVCSGTWKSICSTVMLPTSPEEQQLPSNRRRHLAAGSRSWCKKVRAGNSTETLFQIGTSHQHGFHSFPLLFHSRTEKNRKWKLRFCDLLLSLDKTVVTLLQHGKQKWCVLKL